jgi:hypothetical protein
MNEKFLELSTLLPEKKPLPEERPERETRFVQMLSSEGAYVPEKVKLLQFVVGDH